jgi:hypothetical protein
MKLSSYLRLRTVAGHTHAAEALHDRQPRLDRLRVRYPRSFIGGLFAAPDVLSTGRLGHS